MNNGGVDSYQKYLIGKRLIESAIELDDALVSLMKAEISKLKKTLKNNESTQDIKGFNLLLKNTVLAMLVTDEKIRNGITLMEQYSEEKNKD